MVIRTLTEVLVVGLHAGSAAFPGWPSDEHSTPRGLSFLICPMGRVVPNLHPHRTSGGKGQGVGKSPPALLSGPPAASTGQEAVLGGRLRVGEGSEREAPHSDFLP